MVVVSTSGNSDFGALSLMTIHAHPDDEASKGASTVAMYYAQGVRTTLVCCTDGAEGDIQNPALKGDEWIMANLAEVRANELKASCEAIGFSDVEMLGYRDSGMKNAPANDHPDCFHQAPLDDAVGRLVAIIRRTKPQVILTYGDDHRGYPHPDHVKVYEISGPAFDRAGDPAWYPEAGAPWQPSKLYYTVWAKARLMALHSKFAEIGLTSPYDQAWLDRPGQDDRITTKIDITEFYGVRRAALLAHATQVDPAEPWWFGLPDDVSLAAYPWEDWVLAQSRVGTPAAGEYEAGLFERIPTPA